MKPITADFVDAKLRPMQGTFRLIFDVPIELADSVLRELGGFPQPDTNRVCAIKLLEGD
jgi:hypothetical protein